MNAFAAITLAVVIGVAIFGNACFGFRIACNRKTVNRLTFCVLGLLCAGVMIGVRLQHVGYQQVGCYIGVGTVLVTGGFLVGMIAGFNPYRRLSVR